MKEQEPASFDKSFEDALRKNGYDVPSGLLNAEEAIIESKLKAEDPRYYAINRSAREAYIPKSLRGEEKSEITRSTISQLVAILEGEVEEFRSQLGELVATLIVNFSEQNKGRHPVIISSTDKPFTMLIKVLEYYVRLDNEGFKKSPVTPDEIPHDVSWEESWNEFKETSEFKYRLASKITTSYQTWLEDKYKLIKK